MNLLNAEHFGRFRVYGVRPGCVVSVAVVSDREGNSWTDVKSVRPASGIEDGSISEDSDNV